MKPIAAPHQFGRNQGLSGVVTDIVDLTFLTQRRVDGSVICEFLAYLFAIYASSSVIRFDLRLTVVRAKVALLRLSVLGSSSLRASPAGGRLRKC